MASELNSKRGIGNEEEKNREIHLFGIYRARKI